MKKLLIAALLATPVYALAQETQDEPVEPTAAAAPEGSGEHHAAGHEVHDPTQHFNYLGGPFEHLGKDEYGGKLGDGHMTDPNTGVTVQHEEPMSPAFIWMLVNFGILLLILAKWGRPTVKKVAEDRYEAIKQKLDEAANLRDQAAQKLAEYEARIKDVDVEVKKLVDGIRADAEADKKRILAAAEMQAAQMKRDAELRIAAEIETARAQLTREVTLAATNASEKILRDKVTPDDQRKLVTNFLSNVGGP